MLTRKLIIRVILIQNENITPQLANSEFSDNEDPMKTMNKPQKENSSFARTELQKTVREL